MKQDIFTNFAKRHQIFEPGAIEALSIYEEQSEYQLILEGIFRVERGADVFFSSHKSFDIPPLNDLELADKGLHVARHIFANYEHAKHTIPLNDTIYATEFQTARETFDSEGLIIINDFLDGAMRSLHTMQLNETTPSVNKQPGNMFTKTIPGLRLLIENCLGTSASPYLETNTFYQVVENAEDDNDEQKDYHYDTFFPALKFWWFPENVDVEQGPLVYVKNSPKMTDAKLDWIYLQSCAVIDSTWERSRRRGHPEGSLRVTEDELFLMDLHACPVPVVGNTLVIGNVGGFHGRGNVVGKHTRRAIHGSVRIDTPFKYEHT